MANLREIAHRMSSVRSTMQITRTMEMISTARIQKALHAAEEAEPYKEAITEMLANAASVGSTGDYPLLATHLREQNVLYILIASDRGLAGGFNIVPQREVEHDMRHLMSGGVGAAVITCGRKPTEYFSYRKIRPVLSFTGISAEPTMDEANRIASYVMDGYTTGVFDRVVLKYWHARNRMEQELVTEQLLPLSHQALVMSNKPRHPEALSQVGVEHYSEFAFEPSATTVMAYLIPAYIRTVIFHALLDSAAAEHGARRRAMQSATDNAKEVLDTLGRTYNRVRQSSITTELNEIIGGAAALEEDD